MASGLKSNAWLEKSGFLLTPINGSDATGPLRVCLLVRRNADAQRGHFEVLADLPTVRIYLGAVCDTDARIQEWVRICVQVMDLQSLEFSGYKETLTNQVLDQRWLSDFNLQMSHLPSSVIVTGMEKVNPKPLQIQIPGGNAEAPFATSQPSRFEVCKDDALLESAGLPAYSNSPFRYLHDPESDGEQTFIAVTPHAPANERVQPLETLSGDSDGPVVFNPQGGFLRIVRESPLALEDHLTILEGEAWEGCPRSAQTDLGGILAELQNWSGSQKGLPFLLHSTVNPRDHLHEILFLKLSILRDLMKEVRTYTKTLQRPLLNLSPSSFVVRLEEVGTQFPALWTAKCALSMPGQTHPLEIRSTAERYFIRLGATTPSPFLPEGLGVHSQGVGQVRLRSLTGATGGAVIEGTLITDDYLGVNPTDLLCLTLPVGDTRLEFYAHVHAEEAVGPKEARFTTVATQLNESVTAMLENAAGTVFPKSHYEVWPLASSPSDLYSLGILGIRILLANSKTNLPVLIDEVLSVARSLDSDPAGNAPLTVRVRALMEQDKSIRGVLSPDALMSQAASEEHAASLTASGIWLDAVTLLLRLFPGAGAHSYCADFGDVSPAALETAFDAPLEVLESLLCRLRSILLPSLSSNEEIAGVILAELDGA